MGGETFMKEPVPVEMDEFLVMGIERRKTFETPLNVNVRDAVYRRAFQPRVPGVWEVFFDHKIEEKIVARKNANELLFLYSDYDAHGHVEMVGCEVTSVDDVPEGMVAMPVPAGKYLLFEARGPLPAALDTTWNEIRDYFGRNKDCERAFAVDFELHRDDRPEAVDVFVAVK
jgi:predicted transcriptional regulator YdeE